MGKLKNLNKKNSKDEVHLRENYTDHSRRFLEWVNSLGFAQSFLGKTIYFLEKKFALHKVLVLSVFSVALSFLIFYDFDFSYNVKLGMVAPSDIKSPIAFQVVDEASTETRRKEAEESTPPVFDYAPEVYESVFNHIYRSFRNMRKEVSQVPWPTRDIDRENAIKDFFQHKRQFEQELGVAVPDRVFEWLVEKEFNARIENVIIRYIVKWSNEKLVEGQSNLPSEPLRTLRVRVVDRSGTDRNEFLLSRGEVMDVHHGPDDSLDGIRGASGLSQRDQDKIVKLAKNLLVPNLTFNRQLTMERKQRAREEVPPVQVSVRKNQTIVSAGSVIQPVHLAILNEIRSLKSDRRTGLVASVAAALFVVMIVVLFAYLRRFTTNRVRVETKDIVVMGLVTFFVLGMTKIFLYSTDAAFLAKYGSFLPASFFLYAAPVAAGPMLVGLLIAAGEVVLLYTVFLSFALAMMVDMNFGFLTVSLLGGVAAALGVFACKKRNDIYWAGLKVGLVNAVAIAAVLILQKMGDEDLWQHFIWSVPAGLLGGLLAAMIAMAIIPVLESVFNYTTDVKLLELSNTEHPLLKELFMKASGTYHHCLSVGAMVEAAAEEIGANALLAKVMAYYHDIGKMEHAQYFIENQIPGHNPHDHISPHMSKTVLIAHVKDGAEMGLKHKLGKPIIDGILQHHGTTMISYFYNRALEEQDEEIDHVEADDFRYPGPKPQFKEAALVMLGDSIEAAARSIAEPTATRLNNLVKNIIQSKFLDGQLDECNLTLKDLSSIEASFKRVLLAMNHQRIAYPGQIEAKQGQGEAKVAPLVKSRRSQNLA